MFLLHLIHGINMEKLLKESIESFIIKRNRHKLFKPVVWYSPGTKALKLV